MLAVSVNDIQKIGQIREKLLGSSTEDEVEGVFKQFDILDFPLKTMLLRHTMQVQEVLDVPHDESISDEDAFEEELEFFLDGKWKELV
jgi:hypothetical protein